MLYRHRYISPPPSQKQLPNNIASENERTSVKVHDTYFYYKGGGYIYQVPRSRLPTGFEKRGKYFIRFLKTQ